ncbi:hypothetical protein ASF22_03855 [Methylobacterium sp. Leaf87]|uniref:hypothetical protein n=1 Tax=Methylobacterium sp. Leaf87 TaxID=1736243 RepID=UPI0006F50DAD|nr:hypothetical protein [Methylobacterium sp. Leaf87]KQO69727.1 hypothetical protein ASF22_03855 [Methylobacterium sp. Leaf87]
MQVVYREGLSQVQVVAAIGDSGLRRTVIRFFALQIVASLGLGVCVAYAYGSTGPVSYAERIDFTLRLSDEIGSLPDRAMDGLRLRFRAAD